MFSLTLRPSFAFFPPSLTFLIPVEFPHLLLIPISHCLFYDFTQPAYFSHSSVESYLYSPFPSLLLKYSISSPLSQPAIRNYHCCGLYHCFGSSTPLPLASPLVQLYELAGHDAIQRLPHPLRRRTPKTDSEERRPPRTQVH